MKNIFLSILIILGSFSAFAQPGTPDVKTAQTILNGVSAKYKTYSSLRAVFTMKMENSANQVTDTKTGTVYLKGNKYKLELSSQEIICDNVTIWTYLKDVNEVQINDYEPDENTITPSQIFTIYEKNFLYGYIEEKTVNGKVYQVIELTPNDKTKSYFKIKLMIDKVEKSVYSAKVFDKNGSKTTYEIQKFTPNFTLADSFFSFDPKTHPGIEVIKLN